MPKKAKAAKAAKPRKVAKRKKPAKPAKMRTLRRSYRSLARDYRKEYASFHAKPAQRKRRSSRNKARRKMASNGAKLLGLEVDHKDGNPMNNSSRNLRAVTRRANRSKR